MKLTATHKLIISILVVVVLAIAAILLLIVPQISRLSSLSAEIDQANADYEAASLVLERRQEAKARAASTETELLRLSNELPEAPELPALIIDLQNTANVSGLDFARVTPGVPVANEEEAWLTIPVDMTLRGTWADYIDYLQRLRKVIRQVRIVQFEIVPFAAEVVEGEEVYDSVSMIEAQMQIEVYTMSPDANATEGSVAPPPADPAAE